MSREELTRQAEKHPDCERCQRAAKVENRAIPPHEPAKDCIRGSPAHCTCKRCWR